MNRFVVMSRNNESHFVLNNSRQMPFQLSNHSGKIHRFEASSTEEHPRGQRWAHMHRPLPPSAPCALDTKLANEGDKPARDRLRCQRNRAIKRLREIASYDEGVAVGR